MGTYSASYPAHGATGWDTVIDGIIDAIDTRLAAVETSVGAATTAAANATTAANAAYQKMANTAVKTSAYTAAVNDRVMCDTTSAGFVVTLPSTPADKSRIAVRLVAGTNTVTVNAGGTAHFNAAAGATTSTLTQQYQDQEYQYVLSSNTWDVVKDSNLLATLNNLYAPFGASYKGIAFSTGAQVTTGYDLVPNGLPIVANATLTAVQLTLIYPTIGGTQTWKIVLDRAGTFTTIANVTIADGARGGVTNSLNVSLLAGDLLLVQCTGANGTTYSGLGPSFRAAFGGSLALPSAPTAITGLAVVSNPTSVALTWTMGTGSISNLVRRDGVPYAVTSTGSYTDIGPTGAGLASGETHVYAVDALVPGNIAVGGGTVTSGTSSSYTYYPATAQPVSALTSDFTVTLGSNTGTAAAIDSAGIATFTTGAVGSGATQDIVNCAWIKDANNHSAFSRSWKFAFTTSNALVNLYMSANAFPGLGVNNPNYLQIEFSPTVHRVAMKAAGFNSGSFFNLTTTTAAQATSNTASGNINWPISVNLTGPTFYGLSVVAGLIKPDGTQDIKIYMGTEAQFDANTLPLVNTVTLTAAQRSALSPGRTYIDVLGQQSATTPVAQVYKEKALTLIALSASGA